MHEQTNKEKKDKCKLPNLEHYITLGNSYHFNIQFLLWDGKKRPKAQIYTFCLLALQINLDQFT